MAKDLDPIVLTFGGGFNSRRRPADIEIDECVYGENFDLDSQQLTLKTRKAFALVATADNGSQINGYAQLLQKDGTLTQLIQAGTAVYEWDGITTFTSVGTVSSSARLRGPLEHNFTINDVTIITDLGAVENVAAWDGTTYADLGHNLASTLKAKFCRIRKGRLFLACLINGTTDLPHMLIGSELEDHLTLSVSDRPSSALGQDAPFFLTTPDLKPINGLEEAFGQMLISSKEGKVHVLKGSSAFDFELDSFYEGSAVSGDEAMLNIGNDILFGINGRIESLSGVISFGDVETNDLSVDIARELEEVEEWTMVYDRTHQQAICHPDSASHLWTMHKSLLARQPRVSPWSKWTSFVQPTCLMPMIDPTTNRRVVYVGDSSGRIFRVNDLEETQDGGTNDIALTRTSKLLKLSSAAEIFDADIWIDYRLNQEVRVTLTFIWGGVEEPETSIHVDLPAAGAAFYNGNYFYSGEAFYSHRFQTKIRRQRHPIAGRGNFLQVRVSYTGQAEIEEIGIQLKAAA